MKKEFMNIANDLAKQAYDLDEIPVGAIIVLDGKVIGQGFNKRESTNNITSHAEINAIINASKLLNTWKLDNCELYVSVEPCVMCYGAILQSRIKKVYIGSKQDELKTSSFRRYIKNENNLIDESLLNDISKNLMQDFFRKRR